MSIVYNGTPIDKIVYNGIEIFGGGGPGGVILDKTGTSEILDCGSPSKVKYTFKNGSGNGDVHCSYFIDGSNNNSSWTNVYSSGDRQNWGTTSTEVGTTTQSYRYWRMRISDFSGGGSLCFVIIKA